MLGVLLAGNALSYLNFQTDYSFLRLKQAAVATGWYLPAYYAHVLTGGIILVLGFLQISTRFRKKFSQAHRVLGRIYVGGVLFFSAPGGMIMAFFIDRGPVVLLSFVVQCSLWFIYTFNAYKSIVNGRITDHQNWMWRSFALTSAAITLRIYIYATSAFISLNTPVAYGVLSWLSWVPNLLIAEWIIRLQSKAAKI